MERRKVDREREAAKQRELVKDRSRKEKEREDVVKKLQERKQMEMRRRFKEQARLPIGPCDVIVFCTILEPILEQLFL